MSYEKDRPWLEYNLMSIKKYASGFSEVIVVVPLQELGGFLYLEDKYSTPECKVWIKNFFEHPGKGMVHHEAIVCYADVYCPDANLIVHTDSDCVFVEPVTPNDYLDEDKPVLWYRPYDEIKATGHPSILWQKATKDALQIEVPHETMQRHPAVHYPWIYKTVREMVETNHKIPFIDYCVRSKNDFPQEICEFGMLGAVAWKYFHQDYVWVENHTTEPDPKAKLFQNWSHWLRNDPDKAKSIFQDLASKVS